MRRLHPGQRGADRVTAAEVGTAEYSWLARMCVGLARCVGDRRTCRASGPGERPLGVAAGAAGHQWVVVVPAVLAQMQDMMGV